MDRRSSRSKIEDGIQNLLAMKEEAPPTTIDHEDDVEQDAPEEQILNLDLDLDWTMRMDSIAFPPSLPHDIF